ncbi:hypothetical protein BDQ12DRAFT_684817 [Crucibulum laeve]|uniref:Uncharacterized protein n=1 Tax=Crucibulum laeve TaxID=68775 RepID=A0A5C3LX55_9AGAR|nr:hypothetical protein BDQ12DRAFT_684817 [Crucibulum laeve]
MLGCSLLSCSSICLPSNLYPRYPFILLIHPAITFIFHYHIFHFISSLLLAPILHINPLLFFLY